MAKPNNFIATIVGHIRSARRIGLTVGHSTAGEAWLPLSGSRYDRLGAVVANFLCDTCVADRDRFPGRTQPDGFPIGVVIGSRDIV